MEMLRSGFQAVGLSSGDSDNKNGAPSSAETIERLVSRLNTSTLLEDRRDACRALKGNSYIFNLATLTDNIIFIPLEFCNFTIFMPSKIYMNSIYSNVEKVSSGSRSTST